MAIIPQTQSFKLFGAGASIGATSITLESFKNLDGTNLTMAHFGGTKGFLTIEPSSGTQEEQISFASITNNANGTVTLGTVKTVLDYTPFTETAGLAKTHGGNVEVIVSNTSGFYNNILDGSTASQIANVPAGNISATNVQTAINELDTEGLHKAGAEAVTGVKTFDSTTGRPKLSSDVDTAVVTEFPTWGQVARTASAGASNGSTTVKGIYQTPSDAQVLAGTTVGSTGAELALTVANTGTTSGKIPVVQPNGKLSSAIVPTKFGGTGADGALTISSGTTNIDLAGSQVFVRNYTSVSITGTAAVTFTNPHANGTIIILKSQGNITITSSAAAAIDATGMGAAGGSAGPAGAGSGARGGAGLYIECAGAWNFTGTIKNNGVTATASAVQSGQNGGGGAGSTLILYNTLTANSGTSQCIAGSSSSITTSPFSSVSGGVIGTTSIGFFNAATGGDNSGSTAGALVYPFINSLYSKTVNIGPGAGGGGGGVLSGPTYTNGGVGGTFGINIIALNTEFV
jgi:hypothetical protein